MAGKGGEGNGEGNGGTGRQTRSDDRNERRRGPRIRPRRQAKPSEAIESLINRYGSRDRALEALLDDNYEQREQLREIGEENDALKEKQAPDGAVILTGDDAKSWAKIKELNLAGDKIVERVKKADTLETEATENARSTARKAVADAANMNGDVLDPLLKQFGLDVELRPLQVEKDGKVTTQQIAHVKKSGDANAAWEKLTDFVARDGSPLKPFATALAKKSTTTQQSGTTTTFPDQSAGTPGDDGAKSLIDARLAKNKELAGKDPLRREDKKAS